MKTQRISSSKNGFTLVELLVAMFITTIIISVLVAITSISLDTWNRSRSELRAARQAKAMIDTMARDFESLVTRKGNTNEWLSAIADDSSIGDKLTSTNATKLIFFTAATDRYEGNIGQSDDKGGDVSCVAYQLEYRDPINATGSDFDTFVLNRLLVNPDETFENLLGETQTDPNQTEKTLESVFNTNYGSDISDERNFVCENIYQFSLTFYVQTTTVTTGANPTTEVKNYQVTVDKNNPQFRIKGTGIDTEAPTGVTPADFAAGRVTAVQISATVLSDFGVEQAKIRTFGTKAAEAKFFSQNSYEYSKVVQIPSM